MLDDFIAGLEKASIVRRQEVDSSSEFFPRSLLDRASCCRFGPFALSFLPLRKAKAVYELIAHSKAQAAENPEFGDPTAIRRWADWALQIASKLDPSKNGYFPRAFANIQFDADLDCTQKVPNW